MTEPPADLCALDATPDTDYIALAYLHAWSRASLEQKRVAEAGHGWTAQVYGPGVRAFVRVDEHRAPRLVRYRCRQTPYDYPRDAWPTGLDAWIGAVLEAHCGALCVEVIVGDSPRGAMCWPVDVLAFAGEGLRERAWDDRRRALEAIAACIGASLVGVEWRAPHGLPDDEWIAAHRLDGTSLVLKAPDARYGDGSPRAIAGLWIPPLGADVPPDNEPVEPVASSG